MTGAASPRVTARSTLRRVGRLLACPFCRELFDQTEGPRCPTCDLPLVALHTLPLSEEARAEAAARGELDPPEDQDLGWLYPRRGRALLLGLAALGLGAFFLPWVSLERPDPVALSGFDLARGNAGWLWGGAIGWFLLLPLVVTRRTVSELRGVRVIAVTFSVMTLFETALLYFRPPTGHTYFGYGLEWALGLYGSALLSLLATLVSLRLGGSLEDLRDLPGAGSLGDRAPGETLH